MSNHFVSAGATANGRSIAGGGGAASICQECKYEAPWTNRMNSQEPLLVCPGLAAGRGLRTSGARNWLGAVLPTRNNEWLNGTLPGFTLAFAGSNSDTKPNDRLPILCETHERSCNARCVKKHTLKHTQRMMRQTQRIQSITNGYFGGYIGKRQPSGKAELRKCVNNMYNLRNKMQGQSLAAKQRAVSGRMITDLEMNGTYRGAVEIFNLCRHLQENDVLSAECTRTFPSISLDGRAWLERLKVELGSDVSVAACSWESLVPKTKVPHLRSPWSQANTFDAYGLRPLRHPFRLLSPYEFYERWSVFALLSPWQYAKQNDVELTAWAEGVPNKVKQGLEQAKPGVHYQVALSIVMVLARSRGRISCRFRKQLCDEQTPSQQRVPVYVKWFRKVRVHR